MAQQWRIGPVRWWHRLLPRRRNQFQVFIASRELTPEDLARIVPCPLDGVRR